MTLVRFEEQWIKLNEIRIRGKINIWLLHVYEFGFFHTMQVKLLQVRLDKQCKRLNEISMHDKVPTD